MNSQARIWGWKRTELGRAGCQLRGKRGALFGTLGRTKGSVEDGQRTHWSGSLGGKSWAPPPSGLGTPPVHNLH